jgi:hypothetical protein
MAKACVFGLLLGLSACALGGKTASRHEAAPTQAERVGPKAIKDAQQALSVLGYEPGAVDGVPGPGTVKAVRGFQKDQKLTVDGKLNVALIDKLKAAQAKLPGKSWALPELGMVATFTDGPSGRIEAVGSNKIIWINESGARVERPANFLLASENKARSDAPEDFLQPLKPGTHGSYTLAHPSGSVSTVSCAVGHLARMTVMAGTFDAIDVICRKTSPGAAAVERRYAYAPELRLVIREETASEGQGGHVRELIALQPPTQSWPAAARAGLDWAMTHALADSGAAEPVQWSSTAVPDRFTIQIDPAAVAAPRGQDQRRHCLRYVFARVSGDLSKRYPGLACEAEAQSWEIPGQVPYRIARPALGVAPEASAAAAAHPAKASD